MAIHRNCLRNQACFISGGTANADIRLTVQAVYKEAPRLQVVADITAADSYNLNDFDGDSEGLEVISFYGKVGKVSAALASMELRRYVTGSASIQFSVNEGTRACHWRQL